MEKKGVMKEVRMGVQSEFAMNIINYLIIEENYIYVGNERDVWLENLAHPTVQLIYLNQRNIFNEEQSAQIFKQIDHIRSRIRRRYLIWKLNVAILNLDDFSTPLLQSERPYVKVISVKTAEDMVNDQDLTQFYPDLSKETLERSMSELIIEIQNVTKKKALEVHKVLTFQKRPYVILVFLSILALVFVYFQFQPVDTWGTVIAIIYGAKYNPMILNGEYWRLLTPSLIHFDLMHLLVNMIFTYQFGKMTEQVFGWWKVLILIVGSAFIGNLFSYAFVSNISLGASTVAYGLLGALLFLGIENRKLFMGLVKNMVFPILILSFFWAFIDSSVDGYGHLGGLLGGFLIATILGMPSYPRFLSRTLLAIATLGVLISGLFIRGTMLTENTDYSNHHLAIIYYYLDQGEEEKALQIIEDFDIDIENLLAR